MPTAGQIYADHSNAIEEVLNSNVGYFLPELDPFYKRIFDVRAGEGNAKDIGRDMKIIKTFLGSFSGVMDQGAATDDFTLYGDGNGAADLLGTAGQERMRFNNPTNAFPDPTAGPNQTPFQLSIPMRSSYTSLLITLGELQAEAHEAYIAEVIKPKLLGFARMMSHTISSFLYLSQNDNYAINTLTSTDAAALSNPGGTTDDTMTVTPSNMAIDRLEVGLRVNVADSSNSNALITDTAGSDPTFVVTRVDPLKNEYDLMHRSGVNLGTGLSAAIAVNDFVVYPGSKASGGSFTGYAGLNSWIKTGDTTVASNGDTRLLGAEADSTRYIDVNVHTEFKSLGRDYGGQALTEHELRKVTRLFCRAKNKYGQSIDCFLASDGVDLSMQSQLIGREVLDRTGRVATMRHQGSDNGERPGTGLGFTFDGKSFMMYSSQFVESGTVYGIKTNQANWKRYSPPPPKGVVKSDKLSFAPFYFVGNALNGGSGNIMPYMKVSTTANVGYTLPTEAVQMPGMVRMQMVPEQPAGIKLTNVQEEKIWSDN